jgi:hypothetical protein
MGQFIADRDKLKKEKKKNEKRANSSMMRDNRKRNGEIITIRTSVRREQEGV